MCVKETLIEGSSETRRLHTQKYHFLQKIKQYAEKMVKRNKNF